MSCGVEDDEGVEEDGVLDELEAGLLLEDTGLLEEEMGLLDALLEELGWEELSSDDELDSDEISEELSKEEPGSENSVSSPERICASVCKSLPVSMVPAIEVDSAPMDWAHSVEVTIIINDKATDTILFIKNPPKTARDVEYRPHVFCRLGGQRRLRYIRAINN